MGAGGRRAGTTWRSAGSRRRGRLGLDLGGQLGLAEPVRQLHARALPSSGVAVPSLTLARMSATSAWAGPFSAAGMGGLTLSISSFLAFGLLARAVSRIEAATAPPAASTASGAGLGLVASSRHPLQGSWSTTLPACARAWVLMASRHGRGDRLPLVGGVDGLGGHHVAEGVDVVHVALLGALQRLVQLGLGLRVAGLGCRHRVAHLLQFLGRRGRRGGLLGERAGCRRLADLVGDLGPGRDLLAGRGAGLGPRLGHATFWRAPGGSCR